MKVKDLKEWLETIPQELEEYDFGFRDIEYEETTLVSTFKTIQYFGVDLDDKVLFFHSVNFIMHETLSNYNKERTKNER